MTEQLAFDVPLRDLNVGRALAEQGMVRTLAAEPDPWLEQALDELRRFVAGQGAQHFKMEDFRAWYTAQGLTPPHNFHVWGAFANRAERAGVIVFTERYTGSRSPKTHGHMVKVWRAGPVSRNSQPQGEGHFDVVGRCDAATPSPACDAALHATRPLSESSDFRVRHFLRGA